MPREAPVTRAIREARGWGTAVSVMPGLKREARLHARRAGHPRSSRRVLQTWMAGTSPAMTKNDEGGEASARFRQQRKLARLRLDLGLVGEVGRIDPGKAMIREFRIGRIAARLAHGAVH